jgi:hypothetical protein
MSRTATWATVLSESRRAIAVIESRLMEIKNYKLKVKTLSISFAKDDIAEPIFIF